MTDQNNQTEQPTTPATPTAPPPWAIKTISLTGKESKKFDIYLNRVTILTGDGAMVAYKEIQQFKGNMQKSGIAMTAMQSGPGITKQSNTIEAVYWSCKRLDLCVIIVTHCTDVMKKISSVVELDHLAMYRIESGKVRFTTTLHPGKCTFEEVVHIEPDYITNVVPYSPVATYAAITEGYEMR